MRLLRKTTPLIVILREQIIILPTVSTFLREQHKKNCRYRKTAFIGGNNEKIRIFAQCF